MIRSEIRKQYSATGWEERSGLQRCNISTHQLLTEVSAEGKTIKVDAVAILFFFFKYLLGPKIETFTSPPQSLATWAKCQGHISCYSWFKFILYFYVSPDFVLFGLHCPGFLKSSFTLPWIMMRADDDSTIICFRGTIQLSRV